MEDGVKKLAIEINNKTFYQTEELQSLEENEKKHIETGTTNKFQIGRNNIRIGKNISVYYGAIYDYNLIKSVTPSPIFFIGYLDTKTTLIKAIYFGDYNLSGNLVIGCVENSEDKNVIGYTMTGLGHTNSDKPALITLDDNNHWIEFSYAGKCDNTTTSNYYDDEVAEYIPNPVVSHNYEENQFYTITIGKDFSKCSDQDGHCSCTGPVAYGPAPNGTFKIKIASSAGIDCNDIIFGDVNDGADKYCYCYTPADTTQTYGNWGGTCRCPSGGTYLAGEIWGSNCSAIACFGGEMVNCNSEDGEWRHQKVTCGRSKNPLSCADGLVLGTTKVQKAMQVHRKATNISVNASDKVYVTNESGDVWHANGINGSWSHLSSLDKCDHITIADNNDLQCISQWIYNAVNDRSDYLINGQPYFIKGGTIKQATSEGMIRTSLASDGTLWGIKTSVGQVYSMLYNVIFIIKKF